MKTLIFTILIITICAIRTQAQTPTMQDLIDKVMDNFVPIDSLHVDYTMELYRPSVGLEPPDLLDQTRKGEFIYNYPDTTLSITIDSTGIEAESYVYKKYSKIAGSTVTFYEKEFVIESGDTTVIRDTEDTPEVWEEDFWYSAYWGMFYARLLFQFDTFIDNCGSAWLNGNPEEDIYIISTYYRNDPQRITIIRKDFYIDYSNGTIIAIKTYDTGAKQGTPENPILWTEEIFSNFQQIGGIYTPLILEAYSPPFNNSSSSKEIYTYIISVTP